VYDKNSFNSLKKSIADDLLERGLIVPSDDELSDYAYKLLNFFDILITNDKKLNIEENPDLE